MSGRRIMLNKLLKRTFHEEPGWHPQTSLRVGRAEPTQNGKTQTQVLIRTTACIIAVLVTLAAFHPPQARTAEKKKDIRVTLISPESGQEVTDTLTLKISVTVNRAPADDTTAAWRVAYYANGKKIATGTSIEQVHTIPTGSLKEGRNIIAANVMDQHYNVAVAHRIILIEKEKAN